MSFLFTSVISQIMQLLRGAHGGRCSSVRPRLLFSAFIKDFPVDGHSGGPLILSSAPPLYRSRLPACRLYVVITIIEPFFRRNFFPCNSTLLAFVVLALLVWVYQHAVTYIIILCSSIVTRRCYVNGQACMECKTRIFPLVLSYYIVCVWESVWEKEREGDWFKET